MGRLKRNAWFGVLGLSVLGSVDSGAQEQPRPVEGIMDNSFLIEEAYNQEPGVVQHIFNGVYSVDRISETAQRRLDFSFTQEWPAYGQAHQFSYTIPYSIVKQRIFDPVRGQTDHWNNGIGDVLLNYRYQVFFDEKTMTGFAPRFSLVLPTGDEHKGFGNGTLGYQWNLPFSTTFGDRWFAHLNAGMTLLPGAGENQRHDLLNYNLGASAIYCVNGRFNLMLEWVANWNQGVTGSGEVERQLASVISPGMRYAFNLAQELQVVVGLGVPIGLNRATPELGGLVYFSVEHRMFGKKAP